MWQMRLNRETVHTWRQAVARVGPPSWSRLKPMGASDKALTTMIVVALQSITPRSGTPATFMVEQIVQIVAVRREDLADLGRPVSHWMPREVAEEVRKRGIVETISTRSVGRFLKSID